MSQPVNIPIPNSSFELGYGASNSQDLGVSPKQLQQQPSNPNYYNEGFYTLSFLVSNHFPNYPGYYHMEIDFGTQELCDAEGWGTGTSVQVTIICPSPVYLIIDQALPSGGLAQGANNLVLKCTVNDGSANGGWPLKFDNVSLTFTPTN